MSSSRKKYNSISIKKKLMILDEVAKKEIPKKDIAQKYGIPSSTLSTLIKSEQKLRAAKDKGMPKGCKRLREGAFPKLEYALVDWMRKVREKNICIDGNILKSKAQEFALRMDIADKITFSHGWIQNFKRRHNLTFRAVCGESGAADKDAAESWQNGRLKRILALYKPEDIYNADETGLFYKLMPNRTYEFLDKKCTGGKHSKERITLLCAANMTGTDKLKLFVIGKANKPRCFKGIRTLPVKYSANKKAWMTALLFEDWIRELDRKFTAQKRKILIVIDNCTAHGIINGLESIKIEFLPPNVTSLIQPLDQGIIQCLKKNYRESLLKRIILNLDNGKDYEVNLLSAIHLAAAAWDSVTPLTISNCFAHAGFALVNDLTGAAVGQDVAVLENAVPDAGIEDFSAGEHLLAALRNKGCEILENQKFSEFVVADNQLECYEDETDDLILERALQQSEDAVELSSEDEEPSNKIKVSIKEAVQATETLKAFFEAKENSEEWLQVLRKVECEVLQTSDVLQQAKITSFFSKQD